MPRVNRTTSQIATRCEARQTDALRFADSTTGRAIDRAVASVWQAMLKAIRNARRDSHFLIHQRILYLARSVHFAVRDAIGNALRDLATWGYRSAVAIARRDVLPKVVQGVHAAVARGDARLREDGPGDWWRGLLQLDLFGQWRRMPIASRIFSDAVTDNERRDLLGDILFEPPRVEVVNRIIYTNGWASRIMAQSGLASPEVIATTVSLGMSSGKTQQQIAAELLPQMEGVRVSARRVARTEGMRVAHEMQTHAWEQLGDMVTGYQIHATKDQNTRPAHAARDSTIYYKKPQDGQLGLDSMPRPPLEADGTVAHNCRCFLTPVLASI